MEIIGFFFLIILVLGVLGVCGWVLKLLGWIFNALFDGCLESCGCLIWMVLIFFVLAALIV